jgi:hypothetical protein
MAEGQKLTGFLHDCIIKGAASVPREIEAVALNIV